MTPSRLTHLLLAAAVITACTASLAHAEEKSSWKFDFSAQPAADATAVKPDAAYSTAAGFGFENTPTAEVVSANGKSALVASKPFYFSANVPEGNYKVTATLGDPTGPSDTTIKAELRRLMVEHVHTDAGQFQTVDFIVNVRRPEIDGGGKVKLKAPRETTNEAWAWDNKLTLEFNNAHPALSSLTIEKVDVPTLYILGDSTVCDQSGEPFCSWGQMLPNFFKDDIALANHGESGETIASSNGAGRFKKILSLIKPGDFFIEQFGHNDMKNKADGAADKYEADLAEWVKQIRAKGATVIVVTPMNRHTFSGAEVTDSLAPYPDKVRDEAAKDNVPLVDLNKMSKALYEHFGEQNSKQLFEHRDPSLTQFDATHHSPMGAFELARCVAEGIRQNCPELAKHLKPDLKPFDPAHPDFESEADFKVPPSTVKLTMTPLGS